MPAFFKSSKTKPEPKPVFPQNDQVLAEIIAVTNKKVKQRQLQNQQAEARTDLLKKIKQQIFETNTDFTIFDNSVSAEHNVIFCFDKKGCYIRFTTSHQQGGILTEPRIFTKKHRLKFSWRQLQKQINDPRTKISRVLNKLIEKDPAVNISKVL